MKTGVKLRIADVIIQMESDFALEQPTAEEEKHLHSERYDNFSYGGNERTDIFIRVKIVDKLPKVSQTERMFITYHFQDRSENWRLLRKANGYIYKSPLATKKQLMLVNKTFNRVTAYLLPKKDKGRVWNSGEIIYDFLQVLLINYFAQRKSGIFTHAVGIKDLDGSGLLFAGKSGAGKSTTARLWYKPSKAMVLNDDRIIVRKTKGKFFIYGSPWHGAFSDYLESRIECAALKKLFFIRHARKNYTRRITYKEAFSLLYPALFPTFWDKVFLENTVSFALDLIRVIPGYDLGFVRDKKSIDFVRKLH
jgi:hypothetical protein